MGISGLLVVASAGVARGQDSPSLQQPDSVITFKSAVELVTVNASVRDGRGHVIPNLRKADFEVLEGGFSRPIKDFFAGESGVSLALLLDISGSMSVGGNMDRARDAIAVATMA